MKKKVEGMKKKGVTVIRKVAELSCNAASVWGYCQPKEPKMMVNKEK